MTTTEDWAEASRHGNVLLHTTMRWMLVHLDGPGAVLGEGWFLFGPNANGVPMSCPAGSPALDLLRASRAADDYIARPRRA